MLRPSMVSGLLGRTVRPARKIAWGVLKPDIRLTEQIQRADKHNATDLDIPLLRFATLRTESHLRRGAGQKRPGRGRRREADRERFGDGQ
ncbi:hypothetical protein SBA4_3440011 [Candidatus Sulfopaludibacter sp. SbA4]|nr:hypothetical protein SBA4_3440011 [Candidatus Sulfopaludibacter sp. SbA4]